MTILLVKKMNAIPGNISFRNIGKAFQFLCKNMFRNKFLDEPFVELDLKTVL